MDLCKFFVVLGGSYNDPLISSLNLHQHLSSWLHVIPNVILIATALFSSATLLGILRCNT